MKAEQLENPDEEDTQMKSRITMAKIDNVWYGEFYAPVNTDRAEQRNEFCAYAAEVITKMRNADPNIPIVIMGDFNAHIKDHYSTTLRSDHNKLIICRDSQLRLSGTCWTIQIFDLEGWLDGFTPSAHIPKLHQIILTS